LNVVPTPTVDNQPEISPLEEIKEDIPFYNENQEINDFNTRVHSSEPPFPVREDDNEHPCIVLFEHDKEIGVFDELYSF
jgi:hypothetical protein